MDARHAVKRKGSKPQTDSPPFYMCLTAINLLRNKADTCAEILQLGVGTFRRDTQGAGNVQAEHFHEALAIDAVLPVVQIYWERLSSGQPDKFFHILNAVKCNDKFFSIFHLALYKPFFFVYNEFEISSTLLYQTPKNSQLCVRTIILIFQS